MKKYSLPCPKAGTKHSPDCDPQTFPFNDGSASFLAMTDTGFVLLDNPQPNNIESALEIIPKQDRIRINKTNC